MPLYTNEDLLRYYEMGARSVILAFLRGHVRPPLPSGADVIVMSEWVSKWRINIEDPELLPIQRIQESP